MTICKHCKQTMPEALTYRMAPAADSIDDDDDAAETKPSWFSKELWINLFNQINNSRSFIVTFPFGVMAAALIIGIGWIVFPGMYYFGSFIHDNIFGWSNNYQYKGDYYGIPWVTGIFTIFIIPVFYFLLVIINWLGTKVMDKLWENKG